jgi:hypothetical protein
MKKPIRSILNAPFDTRRNNNTILWWFLIESYANFYPNFSSTASSMKFTVLPNSHSSCILSSFWKFELTFIYLGSSQPTRHNYEPNPGKKYLLLYLYFVDCSRHKGDQIWRFFDIYLVIVSLVQFFWKLNYRGQFLTPGVKFAPRVNLAPRGNVHLPSGVNTLYCLEEWRGKKRISPPGDNFTPRGQISPLGDNFAPGRQSLPLGAKLRMGLRSLPHFWVIFHFKGYVCMYYF